MKRTPRPPILWSIGSAFLLTLLLLWTLAARAQQPASAPAPSSELVLEGVVRGAQNQSYIKAPFTVPDGVRRITLTFDYTGREQHTALDLGLLDPQGLHCWAGGNKSTLTVGLADATPSCQPGAIPPGVWNVLIGVPNIRAGVISHYTIHIALSSSGAVAGEPAILNPPLRKGPAWFRGDLHTHTAHSDGQCPSQSGQMVPCPVYFTAQAAASRGLDFVAITDHNAASQYDAMRELQPYFDKLLLIPGREITTFQGHINFLGSTDFVDFRLDGATVPDVNTLLRSAAAAGAITSINHPAAPSGEICMGCGWKPSSSVDMHLLTAIEAMNGGSEPYGFNDLGFWDKQLNKGYRLTGIAGSDNHRPMQPLDQVGSVGSPTTVIYAAELSTPAILDAIRAGHLFIDVAGTRDRLLEVTAQADGKTISAGDEIDLAPGVELKLTAHLVAAAGGSMRWILDGVNMAPAENSSISTSDATTSFTWVSDGHRHWIRAELSGPDGKPWLIANPVFLNWRAEAP